MRDLIEAHNTFGRAMLADLTRPDAGPAEPVDGVSADPAAMAYPKAVSDALRASWRNVAADVAGTYDAAMRVMREEPSMPLESPDPWCEDDAAYMTRLGIPPQATELYCDALRLADLTLDHIGKEIGRPRARLVRVDGDGE